MSVFPTRFFYYNVQYCDNIYNKILKMIKINFRMARKAPRTNEKKETRQEKREMKAEWEKNRE